MRNAHLVLDERLLEEAVKASGERTYKAAVTRALEEFVRRAKARQILSLRGSGLWEGNLGEMRGDAERRRRVRRRVSR
ncbi:MAG: type II toxin-antitoxin system VapB family antitoxin [Acidithiobacillales bacterium]